MSSVHFASQLLKAWLSMNIAGTKVSTREVHALVDEALITISTNPSETLGGAARNCAFYYYYSSSSWGFDSGILLWVCGFFAGANIVFVESPVNVGFSYSSTASDYSSFSDSQTGRQEKNSTDYCLLSLVLSALLPRRLQPFLQACPSAGRMLA